MLDWINWLKSFISGNAAGKLTAKTRLDIKFWVLFEIFLFSFLFNLFRLSVLQVSEEKSCMQFSIQRPTLPSTETHPEERLYRRLDVTTWLHHLNQNGQVEEEYKLRKVGMSQWEYLTASEKRDFHFQSRAFVVGRIVTVRKKVLDSATYAVVSQRHLSVKNKLVSLWNNTVCSLDGHRCFLCFFSVWLIRTYFKTPLHEVLLSVLLIFSTL